MIMVYWEYYLKGQNSLNVLTCIKQQHLKEDHNVVIQDKVHLFSMNNPLFTTMPITWAKVKKDRGKEKMRIV